MRLFNRDSEPLRGSAKLANHAILDFPHDQLSHGVNMLSLIACNKNISSMGHSSQGFVRIEYVALEIPVRFFFVEGNSF
jgi:hypothetical protein